MPLLLPGPEFHPASHPHASAPQPLSPVAQEQHTAIASSRAQALHGVRKASQLRLLRFALPGWDLASLELGFHPAQLPQHSLC